MAASGGHDFIVKSDSGCSRQCTSASAAASPAVGTECTLRAAIQEANFDPVTEDTIVARQAQPGGRRQSPRYKLTIHGRGRGRSGDGRSRHHGTGGRSSAHFDPLPDHRRREDIDRVLDTTRVRRLPESAWLRRRSLQRRCGPARTPDLPNRRRRRDPERQRNPRRCTTWACSSNDGCKASGGAIANVGGDVKRCSRVASSADGTAASDRHGRRRRDREHLRIG